MGDAGKITDGDHEVGVGVGHVDGRRSGGVKSEEEQKDEEGVKIKI